MKVLFLCSFLALVGITSGSADDDFETFAREHDKKYDSAIEESMRRAIFERNQEFIEKFNRDKADELGFKLGFSQLTDLSPKEISTRLGFRASSGEDHTKNSLKAERFFANLMANVSDDPIPDEVDWRKVPGIVSEVKDQGQCSSDWAFAATGALEGQMVKRAKGGKLIPLSEQNLVDCSANDAGCNGGSMDLAFRDIGAAGGIMSEAAYPYKANDGFACKFNRSQAVFGDEDFFNLIEGDEEYLKKTVATYGPVSVSVDSSSPTFAHYKSGIYTDKDCQTNIVSLNHAVLVVGYGIDKELGLDYWLVKNSWGPKWGEQGYIRMARNQKNLCGIATAGIIPIFTQV